MNMNPNDLFYISVKQTASLQGSHHPFSVHLNIVLLVFFLNHKEKGNNTHEVSLNIIGPHPEFRLRSSKRKYLIMYL